MKFASFKSSALKSVGAVSLCVALGAGLVGCGGNGAGGGAVAATVNGQDIMEQTDIDSAMEETKAMFESDEAFQEALEASSMTEESYIEDVIRPNLLQTKLAEAVAAQDTEGEGEDATLAQAQAMSEQFNGAKRSSHILLTAEEGEDDAALAARAQELLDQINAGEISFEDAASQYSTDTGSAANGGDVGWDALSTFVTEYQDALAGLEKDQIVAAPVKSEYGYHIIKVTDVYEVPEGGITSVDQLPTEFQEYLTYMEQSNASQNFSTWFEEYRNNAEITVNPMPEGLPYAIDLAPYEEAAAQNAEGDAAATEGTEQPSDETMSAEDQAAADAAAADAAADEAAAGEAGADAAADDQAGDAAAADQAVDEAAADQTAADQAGADAAADQAAADQAAEGAEGTQQ